MITANFLQYFVPKYFIKAFTATGMVYFAIQVNPHTFFAACG
jgi:hypothetical protein